MLTKTIRDFLRLESASGILIMAGTLLAMIAVNSPLKPLYDLLLNIPVEVRIAQLEVAKPLLMWINDGLMALFFFLVGLELKREILEGELSDPRQIALPGVAALGGMLVPSLIYIGLNWDDPMAMKGWAIPSATDIAFALGVLSLLGPRVPASLKLFLLTLAIIDDLGAILIIALFYSAELSTTALIFAGVTLLLLGLLNRRGILNLSPYLLLGLLLWLAVLKSGVHATLAGVLLAAFIPLRVEGPERPPLRRLEHDLHGSVAFAILPLFAFANSGISFAGLTWAGLLEPVPLGISLGLLLGKPLGVTAFAWVAVRLGLARLPEGIGWREILGVAVICGIGFTMSLFISSLAFEQGQTSMVVDDRLGILAGSTISAVIGYFLLRYLLRGRAPEAEAESAAGR